MSKCFVYGLLSPEDEIIMYVGSTSDVVSRLRNHIVDARKRNATNRNKWIRSLILKGLRPTLVILEECDSGERAERERYWITQYRIHNPDLTNKTIPRKEWQRQAIADRSSIKDPLSIRMKLINDRGWHTTSRIAAELKMSKQAVSSALLGEPVPHRYIERIASSIYLSASDIT